MHFQWPQLPCQMLHPIRQCSTSCALRCGGNRLPSYSRSPHRARAPVIGEGRDQIVRGLLSSGGSASATPTDARHVEDVARKVEEDPTVAVNESISASIGSSSSSGSDSGEDDAEMMQRLRATSALTERYRASLRRACLLYTSPSPRDRTRSRMPSSA